jgi:hypothetical protein
MIGLGMREISGPRMEFSTVATLGTTKHLLPFLSINISSSLIFVKQGLDTAHQVDVVLGILWNSLTVQMNLLRVNTNLIQPFASQI